MFLRHSLKTFFFKVKLNTNIKKKIEKASAFLPFKEHQHVSNTKFFTNFFYMNIINNRSIKFKNDFILIIN